VAPERVFSIHPRQHGRKKTPASAHKFEARPDQGRTHAQGARRHRRAGKGEGPPAPGVRRPHGLVVERSARSPGGARGCHLAGRAPRDELFHPHQRAALSGSALRHARRGARLGKDFCGPAEGRWPNTTPASMSRWPSTPATPCPTAAGSPCAPSTSRSTPTPRSRCPARKPVTTWWSAWPTPVRG
jgi:hypothetical protein